MNDFININVSGAGEPLIFFHGWGFNHTVWLSILPKITSKYKIYLIDLPGFGNTMLMAWDVFKPSLLNQLPAEFAVVGWSMGGLYAMRLAVEAPNRVGKLLLIASTPCFIQHLHWPGIAAQVVTDFMESVLINPYKTMVKFLAIQLIRKMPKQIKIVVESREGLMQGLKILLEWDLRSVLHQYTGPTCFLFGKLDRIIPLDIVAIMRVQYPLWDYKIFDQAAHIPFLSHQDDFIDVLDEMMA